MPKTDEAPAWFSAQMEANRKKIAEDTAATVGRLSATLNEKIEQTNRELSKHNHDVDAIMKEMQRNINNCIRRDDPISKSGTWAAAAASASAADKQKQTPPMRRQTDSSRSYWWSRRCARFWSIEGETEGELRAGLMDFLNEKMHIPSGHVCTEDIISVRRHRAARGKKEIGEVIVLFADVSTRDRITYYSRNLGNWVDPRGKPTAGVRPDVPAHLGGVHRTLMRYGYALHSKYKFDKNLKRNVRFDDSEETMVIDVRLPGREKWVTVRFERALKDQRDMQRRDDEMIEDIEDFLSTNPGSATGMAGDHAPGMVASSASSSNAATTGQRHQAGQSGRCTPSAAASAATPMDMSSSSQQLPPRGPQNAFDFTWSGEK